VGAEDAERSPQPLPPWLSSGVAGGDTLHTPPGAGIILTACDRLAALAVPPGA
jgi:hypothetical protein